MTAVPERVDVAIVGGGQAGLSLSKHLCAAGVDHVVLERSVAFHAWRSERWDAFTLVTPNFQCRLPGHPYDGDEPEGFMARDEIVAWLERYLATFAPPLVEGVTVERVSADGAGFLLATSAGPVRAGRVVLCVGGYHVPFAPPVAVSDGIAQVHSVAYRSPAALPDGAVLVVGTGQSGAQIAEDLHLAGRDVHLCVGDAPRVARRYRGRDVVSWLEDMGHYEMTIDQHPEGNAARKEANHYVTGRDGGHDLDLRAFAADGMALHGRLLSVADGVATFGDDLAEKLDAADATYDRINAGIDRWIAAQGVETADGPSRYEPVWRPPSGPPAPLDLAAAGVGTIVWCTGFRADWSWVDLPFLDRTGYPDHVRGVVDGVPGLFVLGLPWLHTWGSGRFASIDRDAAYVADAIVRSSRALAA